MIYFLLIMNLLHAYKMIGQRAGRLMTPRFAGNACRQRVFAATNNVRRPRHVRLALVANPLA